MTIQVHDTRCLGCGEPADVGQTKCRYCRKPVLISTFNSVYSMSQKDKKMFGEYVATCKEALQKEPGAKDLNTSIAMCYLTQGLHDEALGAFKKAIEANFDNSETLFYAAICLLKGKKAFLAQRPEINKIEEYINAALMIEPNKGIYHYFWAYIKYDYFERKSLNTTPTWREALAKAKASGLSPTDVEQLYGILGVPRPEVL